MQNIRITSATLKLFGSFMFAAIPTIALAINSFFYESFNVLRLGLVLGILILIHLLIYGRFLFCREFVLYTVFVGYMIFSLFWTADLRLAMNTLLPALNFVLILILFSALVTYHDLRAVLAGVLSGFLIVAAAYTLIEGFPFVKPVDFSYNAVAGVYLFGLFIALAFGWYTRSTVLPLTIGLLILIHILATTSIKTNLGLLLGVTGGGLMYFKYFIRLLRRNAITLVTLSCIVSYAVGSNDGLCERLQAGFDRVILGVEILIAHENLPGITGFEARVSWLNEGLKGWVQNPLFGYGVEAFRDHYGMTSHLTPIDLLYNSGLIGFVLFYAIFVSMTLRLFHARDMSLGSLRLLIFGALICYLFITLTATMHYNTFLAVFIAISTALLRQHRRQTYRLGFIQWRQTHEACGLLAKN